MFKSGDIVRLRQTPVSKSGETRTWIESVIQKYGHGPHVYKCAAIKNGFQPSDKRCFIATMDGEVLSYQEDGWHKTGEWITFRQCDIERDEFLTAVSRRRRKINAAQTRQKKERKRH